jgi:hypothetical protein
MLVAPTSTLLADEFPVVVLLGGIWLGGVNAGIALDRTSTDNSRKQTGPHPRRSRRGYAEKYDTNRDRITDPDVSG